MSSPTRAGNQPYTGHCEFTDHSWQEEQNFTYLPTVPDLVGTVPIWRPKPDVPPDDPKKPIRPDLSQSTPKNTILKPAFACSLCSSLGIQGSSGSFGLFSCTRPWQAVFQTKNLYTLGHCSGGIKSSFSCHFPPNARNFAYISGLFFLAVNV